MSLTAAILAGRTGLTASQVGIQVAGHNMANVSTPGYARQIAHLRSLPGARSDLFQIGRGVGVLDVRRQVDTALQARLRAAYSDEAASGERANVLAQLENVLNELTDADLSSRLNDFFTTWSEAANLLSSNAVVVEESDRLAQYIRSMRSDLTRLREEVERRIDATATDLNGLLDRVARLNAEIAAAEGGGAQANGLRDQRDTLLAELSAYADIDVVEAGSDGMVDVLVGSTPVVLGGVNRGVEIRRESIDGTLTTTVVVAADGEPLPVTGGTLGGLLSTRDGAIDQTIDRLDAVAARLIFNANRIHSTGSNGQGMSSARGTLQITLPNRTRALNDPANSTLAALPYAAENGGFLVNVRNTATGALEQVRIDVDLDGRTNTGAPGFADDTSAEDIRAAIDAIDGLSARFTSDGRLEITAEEGVQFSFEDDTSGVLAVLGVNALFSGSSARDIAVRPDLLEDPGRLALGRTVNGELVENGTALALADLQNVADAALGGRTISKAWSDAAQSVGVRSASARAQLQSDAVVREGLEAQHAAVSGVSIDEESINLLSFQRQFQASSRVIQVADELLNTLIGLL